MTVVWIDAECLSNEILYRINSAEIFMGSGCNRFLVSLPKSLQVTHYYSVSYEVSFRM